MTKLLELTASGVSVGCVYALIATGFVLVFKATRVINFAHTSILMLGAYVVARTHEALGFWTAVTLGALIAACAAAVVEVVLLRRLRGADSATLSIVTIGVEIVIATELVRRIGTDILPSGAPWGADVVHIAGIAIPEVRLVAALVAVLLIAAFTLVLRRSDWGIAMRAAAADQVTAALMGVRLSRVGAAAWALAGALAAVAGVFLTSFPSPGIDNTTGLVFLGAVPAAVLGGLDSLAGALLGGLVIGLVVTFCAGYQDQLAFLGRGLSEVAPYVVMLVVLLVRPAGLLGSQGVSRV